MFKDVDAAVCACIIACSLSRNADCVVSLSSETLLPVNYASGANVRFYEIHRIDKSGAITSSQKALCETDSDAIAIGRRLLSSQTNVEVWRGGRLVECLSTSAAALCWLIVSRPGARSDNQR